MNIKLITLAGVTLGAVAASQAATLTFEGVDTNKAKNITINYNGNNKTVKAGTLNFRLDGGDVFEAYCIDLENWITNGDTYDVNVTNTSIVANGALIENLFANNASGVDSKNKGAALQLAIWDAVVDGGDGIGTGNFQATVDSTLEGLIQNYQAAQYAPDSQQSYLFTYFEATTHTLGNNHNKFQNVFTGEAVPEPATMTLLGLGALAALKRRKKA